MATASACTARRLEPRARPFPKLPASGRRQRSECCRDHWERLARREGDQAEHRVRRRFLESALEATVALLAQLALPAIVAVSAHDQVKQARAQPKKWL